MIAYLSGKVAQLEPTHVIIDCGGIGYLVKISLNTYTQIQGKTEAKLHTHFMVREDAQVLFGFSDAKEQKLFEQLISISGVGGNTAITILSSISANDLVTAVANEDAATLKRVKGIGAKTAGRIILELKDKINLPATSSDTSMTGKINLGQKKQEALAALIQLGFSRAQMSKRLDRIVQEQGEDVSVEEMIKLALRNG
ncbi:MAG: Holliday junction branch migration protein RuvA [Bacteroidota bacterium]